MWTVKDIYPSRTNPGMISVQYWNEEEEKNCKSVVKDFRNCKSTDVMIEIHAKRLNSQFESKRRLQPVCAELAAKFIPAPEQEAASAAVEE